MARGKVQMRRIENPVHRQVTFCKRRMGLLKKARELSVLCDAAIGVIVISPHGKIYDLATNGNMQGLIERYRRACSEMHGESSNHNETQTVKQEVLALTHEIDLLQKGFRYMHGENDINHMNLVELQTLENNLEMWANNIRSQKMQIISREIDMLKNKEAILQAVNGVLQERIIEQNGILNFSGTVMTPSQLTMESNYYL
ncbi:MADS-box transcription factor 26 [Zea mays]|uniref:MADS-box transcription factor 26 n=1 Tax=Zea mays TaxID=4577 RepID=A0A3L6G5B1_MAIZE|nr:MADS-box transcription factor 26 [Zea mays]